MSSLQVYFAILGLGPSASVDEIRKAYRDKVKLYHPDRNPAPDAHQRFVEIGEAYEYLLAYKQGRIRPQQTSNTNNQEEQKRRARQKAAEQARLRYEEFLNSDYYKSTSSISSLIDVFIFAFVLVLMCVIPVLAWQHNGQSGLISTLILDVFGLAAFVIITARNGNFSWKKYRDAFAYFARWKWFYVVVLSLFNIIVFLRVGLQTLIPLLTLLLAYFSFAALVFCVLWIRYRKFRWFPATCIVPFAINLLLLVNYIFAGNNRTEQYLFDTGETSVIYLEDGIYEAYPGIRIFFDYTEVRAANVISYQMADGLLGLKVMKDYRFIYDREMIR